MSGGICALGLTVIFLLCVSYRGDFDREDEDPEYKPTRVPFKDEIDVRISICNIDLY